MFALVAGVLFATDHIIGGCIMTMAAIASLWAWRKFGDHRPERAAFDDGQFAGRGDHIVVDLQRDSHAFDATASTQRRRSGCRVQADADALVSPDWLRQFIESAPSEPRSKRRSAADSDVRSPTKLR